MEQEERALQCMLLRGYIESNVHLLCSDAKGNAHTHMLPPCAAFISLALLPFADGGQRERERDRLSPSSFSLYSFSLHYASDVR